MRAQKGEVIVCSVKEEMKQSPIEVILNRNREDKNIEDEDVLVVAGRGSAMKKMWKCEELAKALGGQLAFARPMIEMVWDVAHQVGLSGRTVH